MMSDTSREFVVKGPGRASERYYFSSYNIPKREAPSDNHLAVSKYTVRCLKDEEIEEALIGREHAPPDHAHLISRLAGGDYSYALELFSEDVASQRSGAVEFLRSILSGRSVKLFEEIEERVAENDRRTVEQLLMLLLVWFRDAMMMKEQAGAGIINQDQREDLSRFTARFKDSNFPATIGAVERGLELLRGNVYLPLVLLSVSIQLKRILLNAK